MKKQLLVFSFLAFVFSAQAQLDTLLHEDFQVVDIFLDWQNYTNGDDPTWTHFDEDAITPNGGDEQLFSWFSTSEFWPDTAVNTNFVAGSFSWLEGRVDEKRSYCIRFLSSASTASMYSSVVRKGWSGRMRIARSLVILPDSTVSTHTFSSAWANLTTSGVSSMRPR